MDRLVSDVVIRRSCQGILLGILIFSSLLSLFAGIILWLRAEFGLEGWLARIGIGLFNLMSLPYKAALAPLAVVITAAVPVVLATVCFKVSGEPPAPTADLNRTGHIAFCLTIFGMLSAGLCLMVLQTYAGTLDLLLPDDPSSKTAMQGLISTIASFHCVYFLQLMGLQPK
jgi:hypothetical protein